MGVLIEKYDPTKNEFVKGYISSSYREALVDVEKFNKKLAKTVNRKGYYWTITIINY